MRRLCQSQTPKIFTNPFYTNNLQPMAIVRDPSFRPRCAMMNIEMELALMTTDRKDFREYHRNRSLMFGSKSITPFLPTQNFQKPNMRDRSGTTAMSC